MPERPRGRAAHPRRVGVVTVPTNVARHAAAAALALVAGSAAAQPLPQTDWVRGGGVGLSHVDASPDGARLLTVAPQQRRVDLWDIASGRVLSTVLVPGLGEVGPARFAQGGASFVHSAAGVVRQYDAAGNVVRTYPGTVQGGFAASPGLPGAIALARGNSVDIYDAATGQLTGSTLPLSATVNNIAFTKAFGGLRLAVQASDGPSTFAFTFATTGGAALTGAQVFAGEPVDTRCFAPRPAPGPDGPEFAMGGGQSTTIGVAAFEAGPTRLLVSAPWFVALSDLAYSPSGATLAIAGVAPGGHVLLYNASNGAPESVLFHGALGARSLRFVSESVLATAGDDAALRTWDLAAASERLLSAHDGAVGRIAVFPGGARVASAVVGRPVAFDAPSDNRVALWSATGADARRLRIDGQLDGHETRDLLVHPDGRRVFNAQFRGPGGDLVHVMDADTGERNFTISVGVDEDPRRLFLSADGARLLVVGTRASRFYRASDGASLGSWGQVTGELPLAQSPARDRVLLADNSGGVALRSFNDGQAVADWFAHLGGVASGAFSPDGSIIATAGGVGPAQAISLWTTSGALVRTIEGVHTLSITCLAFTPDGSRLLSASLDGTIKMWRVSDGANVITWSAGGNAHATAMDIDPATDRFYYGRSDGAVIKALIPPLPPLCRADLNNDGELTFDDIQAFVALYNANDPRADFNSDGEWTFDDIQAFIAAYNAGC
jgi:WD40 repeat protein